ncbi:IS110 family transposase [Thiolapillus sp.]|nr:IS110 family transposase [Thiolapillus sp.]
MAGLDPKHHQSGSSINKKARISKVGNRYLRQALYMPALSAARHDKHVNGYYKAPDRKSWTQENTGHLCGDAQVVTRRSRHAQTTKAI